MNLQQLEYIVAVDVYRHFSKAAEACYITQPTLSMMIQKLEEELGITIFDRGKQPVIPTEAGGEIIAKARAVLKDCEEIKELASSLKGELRGELRIGIIPTVAPYLLPIFLSGFLKKYPKIKVKISELTTDLIVEKLERNLLDVGILATPLDNPAVLEQPLYKEEFVVYASTKEKVLNKKYLLAEDINIHHLWLLEEGHCLRSQILKLCELKKKDELSTNLEYAAGSIDSLVKMIDQNEGITILPYLAAITLNAKQKKCIREFKSPVPVREISLVTYRHFVKKHILEILKKEIMETVDEYLSKKRKHEVIPV